MGKKTTPTKDKKAKTAVQTSRGAAKAKSAPLRKKADKGKPVEKVLKAKATGKGLAAPAKASRAAGNSPKTATKTGKIDKHDKTTPSEVKLTAKSPQRAKSNNRAASASTKSTPRLAAPVREPREIAGLPKLPAFGSTFDRPPHREAKKGRNRNGGGNGDSVDDSSSDSLTKTYLTEAELDEFRQLLVSKRQEIVRDVTNLEDEAIRQASGASASSSMPIHMADLGTDTWEQELTLGLIANERGLLREIDEAIERIENGTYGMCLATNKRISKTRLQAKPWAKYCIEYARKRELGLA